MATVEKTVHGTTKGAGPRGSSGKIHVKKAANGYIITRHHRSGGKGGTKSPESHVFTTHEEATEHLRAQMNGYKD